MQERGFLHQCSDLEGLDAKLIAGVQSGYQGFDATAKSLHVGNLLGIMMLHWFQKCGHKPVTLMGGGTTKIGDPSGKDTSRQLLTEDAINGNINSIKQVFAKFLTYGNGPTDAIMVNNNDWLKDLQYIDFLRDVGRHFSINRMLTMDSVKLRLDREQPLSFLEFNYMILQGYDFVELNKRYGTVLQLGGSDQWGNIISGVELGRRMNGLELYAFTCPLLATADGKKMGKSADGAMWLNADMLSPYDYYQFWRNTHDADVVRFLKLYTLLPMDEIARLGALKDAEINDAKKVLAFEATKLCHGAEAAQIAADTARTTFEQGGVGDDLPTINLSASELASGAPLADIYVKLTLCDSKGEFRRLVTGGGVRVNDEAVTDPALQLNMDYVKNDTIKLSAGKKRHALIKVKA